MNFIFSIIRKEIVLKYKFLESVPKNVKIQTFHKAISAQKNYFEEEKKMK